MPSNSRRELLRQVGVATTATLGMGSLAGCGTDTDTGGDEDPLVGRRLYVHDDVDTPAEFPTSVDDIGDATAALLPTAERAERIGVDALDRGVTVCFVGQDAPRYLQRVCAADGRPYGVPSMSWTPQDVFGVATPYDDRLDTHHVEHLALPDGLPWGVSEALDWEPDDGAGTPVGRVRRSGRTDVGAYDARERLSVADGRATVRTTAMIESAPALPWERYDVARVGIELSFYDRPITGATTQVDAGDRVRGSRSPSDDDDIDGSVSYGFVPTAAATRRRLAAEARTTVGIETGTESLAYIGNARFRWRRRIGLGDGEWVAHTPGQRSWHELDR